MANVENIINWLRDKIEVYDVDEFEVGDMNVKATRSIFRGNLPSGMMSQLRKNLRFADKYLQNDNPDNGPGDYVVESIQVGNLNMTRNYVEFFHTFYQITA